MAAVGLDGVVKKNLLDRTVAEKVFRPWWDTVEDYLLNVLIFLGKTKIKCCAAACFLGKRREHFSFCSIFIVLRNIILVMTN